jgi:hypothetical protein
VLLAARWVPVTMKVMVRPWAIEAAAPSAAALHNSRRRERPVACRPRAITPTSSFSSTDPTWTDRQPTGGLKHSSAVDRPYTGTDGTDGTGGHRRAQAAGAGRPGGST